MACKVIILLIVFVTSLLANDLDKPNPDRHTMETERRAMDNLEMCHRKFKPDSLISNNRPGKWVTQIWQKDRMFRNLSKDSLLLNLPNIPVHDFLEPNQIKSYIVYKEPGNWGPLTILIKPQQTDMRFANLLMVVIILNDTVDLSDAIKLTSHGEPVYSYTTFCAPAGQYRIILQSSNEEPIHVELVHKYEHMHQIWTHSSQLLPVRIRCRRRKQNKQMLIKWDKCNVDGNVMQYCIVINNQRGYRNLCEGIQHKLGDESGSCKMFDFLHEGFATSKGIRRNMTRRLEANGTSIFCTGTRSQQMFRRFKPNMNYFIDVFGVHPKLSQLTLHLGSLKMWHSHKNNTIPLYDGRTGHGKLSQSNDLITFSFKPLLQDTKEILLYIVPCGGTVMMRILRQKRLLMEVRHIHKPSLQQINMTELNSHEGRVVIKVLPNNVDESLRNIKVELTATSTDKTHRPPVYPRNLTVTYIPTLNSCNSVELLWHPVPDSKLVRYCMLLMISSPIEDVGICGVDEMIFKHPRFQQLHCFYSKFGPLMLERMKITNLSPGLSYTIYLFARLKGSSKDTIKYEHLRINHKRMCHYYLPTSSTEVGAGVGKVESPNASHSSNFYDFNRIEDNYFPSVF